LRDGLAGNAACSDGTVHDEQSAEPMNKTDVQTIGRSTDNILVGLASLVALAGVIGFSFWSELPLVARFGMLLGGLALGAGIAWFSAPGKRFIAFAQEAYEEARKVTWPTSKETVQTTGVVFLFVAIMAIFLFLVDKSIEWGLYDLVLGWKR
jgi:preprotein translocase subunit SecE